MGCIPRVDAAYVAAMEDVLDLYHETPDPSRPVICFDESPKQLIGETRTPVPARPGQLRRIDYEYRHNGTANLFVFADTHRPWRKVKVTSRRTAADFAACMRELSDVHFSEAGRIRVVLDNLSTHTPAALYSSLPAKEARPILRRIESHYTPKHASWLNMVEIEIGVLPRQCLSRRIPQPGHSRSRESQPGSSRETAVRPASTGCSPPKKPDKNWPNPTQKPMLPSFKPKSQNLCDTTLGQKPGAGEQHEDGRRSDRPGERETATEECSPPHDAEQAE